MTHVFLTGASGFLGGHVARELRAAGCKVRALSRRPESDESIRALDAEPVRADLADVAGLMQAVDGCEAVFHVAADTSMWRPHAARQYATNVDGTRHLLRAAERVGVQAFIHTSSVSAHSHLVEGTLNEDSPQRGGESWISYERTKYLGELAVRRADVPWIVFNPSHILGPGDRHNWARLIMLVDREKLPGIPPGTGSFADVREIARAQVRAWQRKRFGERYLVGGEDASFAELVRRIGVRLERTVPSRVIPPWALMGSARASDLWSRIVRREPDITPESARLVSHHLSVDSGKAERELEYTRTPLDRLLDETLAWMRHQRMVG
jgi:dihydroflavonol-4-reductase